MENASKALIIAGAILISILLISVGIMIFNSSSGLFSSATSKMSDQEKQMFNSTFTMYNGTRVSGSSVTELLRSVLANNSDTETNPEITINGEKLTSDKIVPKGAPDGKDETVKKAYQYTVECEDKESAAAKADGVISNIKISRTAS